MIYTAKGFPRGMALVAFMRGVDAARASERYDGKVIDGKRAIKLEVVLDRTAFLSQPLANAPIAPRAPKAMSLFERIGPASGASSSQQQRQQQQQPRRAMPRPSNPAGSKRPVVAPSPYQPPLRAMARTPAGPTRKRQKKGPRRVKKSIADLDLEIEEYSSRRTNGVFDAQMEGL
ncbi:hypothetical protein EW145_g679 [Phellinidium pouzarii]|uniref:Chromatin target of PRMT1 protein C-terminal domain-containing protein n=1 Tax=Phellinidium pouzarii TaxID=167371 RepID=A0A4S4LHJ0_9AGAM|nr:hypothetical protein EW145_g679 [Phellinidium pouzarii]